MNFLDLHGYGGGKYDIGDNIGLIDFKYDSKDIITTIIPKTSTVKNVYFIKEKYFILCSDKVFAYDSNFNLLFSLVNSRTDLENNCGVDNEGNIFLFDSQGIIKYDENGQKVFTVPYAQFQQQGTVNSLSVTSRGYIILTTKSGTDYFVIKIFDTGQVWGLKSFTSSYTPFRAIGGINGITYRNEGYVYIQNGSSLLVLKMEDLTQVSTISFLGLFDFSFNNTLSDKLITINANNLFYCQSVYNDGTKIKTLCLGDYKASNFILLKEKWYCISENKFFKINKTNIQQNVSIGSSYPNTIKKLFTNDFDIFSIETSSEQNYIIKKIKEVIS